MTGQGFNRKLTAIFSADVEGYSRMMGANEEATIATLTTYRDVLNERRSIESLRQAGLPG